MLAHIEVTVNGERRQASVPAETTLLDVLRGTWGLTGTKKGCDEGDCGACTVLLDGRPVNACLVLAVRANGHLVTTVEGLGHPDHLHPLQYAFVEYASLQCGFCGPGMLMSSKALLDSNPDPTEAEVRWALSGNLCRCTGYAKIIDAIQGAAKEMGSSGNNSKG